MDNRGAEKLGARLIGEVEEEGLDEVSRGLKIHHTTTQAMHSD